MAHFLIIIKLFCCRGSLWFNCAPYGSLTSPAGVRDVCPTANSTWEVCVPPPPGASSAGTKALNLQEAWNRTAPGGVGQVSVCAFSKVYLSL